MANRPGKQALVAIFGSDLIRAMYESIALDFIESRASVDGATLCRSTLQLEKSQQTMSVNFLESTKGCLLIAAACIGEKLDELDVPGTDGAVQRGVGHVGRLWKLKKHYFFENDSSLTTFCLRHWNQQ